MDGWRRNNIAGKREEIRASNRDICEFWEIFRSRIILQQELRTRPYEQFIEDILWLISNWYSKKKRILGERKLRREQTPSLTEL